MERVTEKSHQGSNNTNNTQRGVRTIFQGKNQMISKKEFYVIECDDCKEKLSVVGEYAFTVYDTPEAAKRAAIDMEWTVDADGVVACDSCL